MDAMKRSIRWTAAAVIAVFVAFASSVCPPAAHLPLIIAIASLGLFGVSFLLTLTDFHKIPRRTGALAVLIGLFQVSAMVSVIWFVFFTARKGTL